MPQVCGKETRSGDASQILALKRKKEGGGERERQTDRERQRERERLSWCFEPSQPQKITSGLERERERKRDRE